MSKTPRREGVGWSALLEVCRIGSIVGGAGFAFNLLLVVVAGIDADLVTLALALAGAVGHGLTRRHRADELTSVALHGAVAAVIAAAATVVGSMAAPLWIAAAVIISFAFPWRAMAWTVTTALVVVTFVCHGLGTPIVWALAPSIFGHAVAAFGDRLLVALNGEIRARRQAEAASLATEEFLSTISHEIRTPMSGILGIADLMVRRPLTADVREPIEVMQRSAESIMRIVEDILDFSRISAVGITLSNSPFDLRALLHEVVALHRARAHARGLRLMVQVAVGIPRRVDADAGRLRQVIANLLSNAVKFTERGSVELTLEGRVVGDVCWTRLRVVDTGVGIPAAVQGKIFEPFKQADDAIARRSGGTGLGLTITRRIVAALGGTIDLVSEVGKGTTFLVEVPLRIAADAPATIVEAAEPRPSLAARILVVDDDALNREVATAQLEALGHRVDVAEGGFEALRRLEESTYDLVLIDCQMPDLDGYETVRRLRAAEGSRRTPVLALTASASASVRERCFESGMDGHLSKPTRLAMLKEAIEPWLPGASEASASPP